MQVRSTAAAPALTGRWCAAVLALVFVSAGAGQNLTVYSEFTRIDPFGKPVRADQGAQPPREILSPAIPRNAFTSFHMVVEGRPGESFTFQVAQNPDNAVRVTAYREMYVRVGGEWVPDGLEQIPLPYDGKFGTESLPDQMAQAFWVDLFAPRSAGVRRIKVEPQAYVGDGWLRYPLEARIVAAALSAVPGHGSGSAPLSAPAAASALGVWTATICGSSENKDAGSALSIRDFIARNAAQDVRFAGGTAPAELFRLSGVLNRTGFCGGGKGLPAGSESYLAVRDRVIGARD